MLDVNEITPPSWADVSSVEGYMPDQGDEGVYTIFKPLLPKVFALVHQAVEAYVNDDDRTFPDEEGGIGSDFPARIRMTGEYYVDGQ